MRDQGVGHLTGDAVDAVGHDQELHRVEIVRSSRVDMVLPRVAAPRFAGLAVWLVDVPGGFSDSSSDADGDVDLEHELGA